MLESQFFENFEKIRKKGGQPRRLENGYFNSK